MKRFLPALLALSIFAGVLMPISASLVAPQEGRIVAVGMQEAHAQVNPVTAAQNQSNSTGGSSYDFYGGEINCNLFTNFAGCIEVVFYFIPYYLGGKVMFLSAWVFDALASLSLSSVVYSGSQFINDGWRVVRDFSNIFLILILLFTAISFVLGLEIGHANPKKMFASVIIVAIVINFSLFITEVIVDTSNSLALVFYNQITVVGTPQTTSTSASSTTATASGIAQPKSISTSLVEAFQPQELQSADFWTSIRTGANVANHPVTGAAVGAGIGTLIFPGIGTAIGAGVGALAGWFATTSSANSVVPPETMITILVIVGVMYFVVAYSLMIAAFAFLGRMVGLWIAIIFSPLAFVSYIVPSLDHKLGGVGWTGWWKSLFEMAFAAPIYFFFLLLISLMTKGSPISNSFNGQSGFGVLVIIIISMLFLIVMLLKATTYVKAAAGEIGEMAVKLGTAAVQGVGGMALAGITGGSALLATRTAGAYYRKQDTELNRDIASGKVTEGTLKNFQSKMGLTHDQAAFDALIAGKTHEEIKSMKEFQGAQRDAERKLKTAQKMASRSFDLRQTGIGNAFSKATGVNMEGAGIFATSKVAGGYEGIEARKAAKQQAFQKKFDFNHDQDTALEDEIDEREASLEELRGELNKFTLDLRSIPKNLEVNAAIRTQYPQFAGLADGTKVDNPAYVTVADEAKKRQTRINELSTGKKDDPATGYHAKYQTADIGHTNKSDGTKVTSADVAKGALRKESQSLAGLKAVRERNKTDRMKSYAHIKMAESGYGMHGAKFDDYGGVKKTGHIDFTQKNADAMRGWAKESMSMNMKELFNSRNTAEAVGNIANVFSYGITGAIKESLLATKRAVVPGQRKLDARGTNMASHTDHDVHEFKSKYQPTHSGFSEFLSIFKGAGGGHGGGGHDDHGGGGHGAAAGAHH